MNKVHTLMLLSILLVFTKGECLKHGSGLDTRLHIRNHSGKTLFFFFTNSFPDTSLRADNNLTRDTIFNGINSKLIMPGDSGMVSVAGTWESFFSTEVPSGKINVFLFDLDVLRTTPWNAIATNYMVLKRYDLTLDSLKNRNWEIDYP